MKTRWPLWSVDAAGGGVLILTALAAFSLGYQPVQRARAQSSAEESSLAEAEQQLQEQVRTLRGLRHEVLTLQTQAAVMPQLWPLNDQSRRMGELAQLATDLGVLVRELSPREGRREARFVVVPMRLAGDCTLDELRAFVAALHTKFPDMELASLDLGASPGRAAERGPFSMDLWWSALADPADRADHADNRADKSAGGG